MTAIGAETQIARIHGGSESGGDGFLTERQMAGALHQILQKEIVGALLGFAEQHLRAVQVQAFFFADIVVCLCVGRRHTLRLHPT